MRKFTIYAMLTAGILISAAVAFADEQKAVANADEASVVRNLDIFNSLYKELNTFYVDTLDSKKSIETAINSMLDDIDPYTEYIPAEDQEDFQVIATGEYGGIGSYIMERKGGGTYISGPYKNSPAERAGLRTGDHIIMIDSDSVATWPSAKVSARLKGQANTTLKVTVARPWVGADSIKTFTITREKIQVSPVPYHGVTRGNIGYINVTTFNEHTGDEVRQALLELRQNPAVKYVVLDLRGNGGGLLDEAVKVVGMFTPKGTEVLQTRGRSIENFKVYKTSADPIDLQVPLAVLVDGGTASASEITAGALQDLDRAVVIGSRSFGKGLVQTTRQLPFDGLLKVTIAKYYIPSGRLIQEIDYSHRNADGTAVVADSTKTAKVFHTAHGREVHEAGGITPDIKVDYSATEALAYELMRDNQIFDFATKYASQHPKVASPKDFVVTDSIWNEFKRFLKDRGFKYNKASAQALTELRKLAEKEGTLPDSVQAQFTRLQNSLEGDLDSDLNQHRHYISTLLARELMTRYYYQAGEIENSLNDDEALDRAEEVFTRAGAYEKTLNLVPAGKKTAQNDKKKPAKKGKKK